MWKYKLTIYSRDRIAETIALLKYKIEAIEPRMPLIKSATDPVTGAVQTALYWEYLPDDYIRILEYVGKMGHSFDAYLVHYDWDTKALTKLGEYHIRKRYHTDTNFYD